MEFTSTSKGGHDLPGSNPGNGGSPGNVQERSSGEAFQVREEQRVLFQPVPSPKKGRGFEISDKPQTSEQIRFPCALQDGGNAHTEGYSEEERLVDKSGFEIHLSS